MHIDFESFYKIPTTSLKIIGAHPAVPKNYKWAIRFGLMHGYYTVCFMFFTYNMICIDIKELNDFTKACSHGIFFVVYLVVSFFYLVLLWWKNDINDMFELQQTYFDSAADLSAEDQKIVYDYASRGRWVSKLWLVSTIITLVLFPIKGCIMTFYSKYFKGNLTLYPFNENYYPAGIEDIKERLDIFIIIYIIHVLYALYTLFMYSGFSALGPIFILNTCAQIELVTKRVSRLFENEVENNVEEIADKMKTIVIKMQEIYSFVDRINAVFTIVHELFLKASAVLIPLSIFLILKLIERGELGLDYIMFVYTASLLCFVPCFYSDLLMEKGENLRIALYSSGWEYFYDKSSRASLLVLLTRAVQPISIHSMFRVVCLDLFTDMCRQSYSLFNLMNAMLD